MHRLAKKILPFLITLVLLSAATTLSAHEIDAGEEGPRNMHELWRTWGWEPGTLVGLGLSALLYGSGLWRLWRAAGIGHGIRQWEAWCFGGGWITLFMALVSPLHPLGSVLFSAHMVQHELLMLVAAPLMVLGRPMIAFLKALPGPVANSLGALSNAPAWKSGWGFISAPLTAWTIHAVVLWLWHAPALFQATLRSEWVHASQHISFLASALLFWWALIHARRHAEAYGMAVLYLFTTAIHSGLLGALLTFARTPWYPAYDDTANWGLSALEDQQIGGLVMWVPACTIYIVAGLFMAVKMLRESDRQAVGRATRSSVGAAAQLKPEGGM